MECINSSADFTLLTASATRLPLPGELALYGNLILKKVSQRTVRFASFIARYEPLIDVNAALSFIARRVSLERASETACARCADSS